MAGANSVDTHLFQDLDLTFQGSRIDCRTQRAQIVMITDTIDFYALTVKRKSCERIKLDRANPKDGVVAVQKLSVLLDCRYCRVEVRALQIP